MLTRCVFDRGGLTDAGEPVGRRSGGVFRRLSFWVLCLGVSGCCGLAPPPPAKFFKREMMNPYWTLRAFVYAVDTEHWDYAFETLTAESRREFGNQLRFQIAVGALSVDLPMAGEQPARVSIYELVSSALARQRTLGKPVGPNGWELRTILMAHDKGGGLIAVAVQLFLRRDVDKVWRLDLLRTLAELQSRRPIAPEA